MQFARNSLSASVFERPELFNVASRIVVAFIATRLLSAIRIYARQIAAGHRRIVVEGSPSAAVAGTLLDDDALRMLQVAYGVDSHRTVHQDAAYGIRQIVDVALKALSPGIDDTTTAINCIDFLGAILARRSRRSIETPYQSDGGQVRVVTRGPTFPGLLAEAFDQIRQNAEGSVAVLVRLLQILERLVERTADEQRRRALLLDAT